MTITDLVGKVRAYDSGLEPGWLERVYEVADRAHEGQLRASGESYIAHPLAVADILAEAFSLLQQPTLPSTSA